tara:strand:+ start:154 stop:1122 length:969 start_codon:yes stop_codon:yes gene_type:complete
MKNRHLEHPEDAILNEGRAGFYNVLDFLEQQKSIVTVKYDGAPAIVWGINPENNKFFVGTKSVFNKVRVKINYNHNDIEVNHGDKPAVASILHMCLEKLPRIGGVYQCDFIGYGGGTTYKPNTITYKFLPPVNERHDIIVAAHTTYQGDTLKDMCASFGFYDVSMDECNQNRAKTDPFQQEETKFIDTSASFKSRNYRIGLYIAAARVAAKFVKFPTEEKGKQLKTYINSYIRMGLPLDAIKLAKETKVNKSLFQLYNFIIEIKNMIMDDIEPTDNMVECYVDDERCDHEGYVVSNEYGTFKLIHRHQFSYANFNVKRNWDK